MNAKKFINAVANSEKDVIELLLGLLSETKTQYCVIGGLGVNAYVEPVVSLDLDIVVVAENLAEMCARAKEQGFRVEDFPHSINLTSSQSDLRIQLQIDPRYQQFLQRAQKKAVLGYEMLVASKEDVLCGKLWAYEDKTRRGSKRQKDLADILRLLEAYPELEALLPESLRKKME